MRPPIPKIIHMKKTAPLFLQSIALPLCLLSLAGCAYLGDAIGRDARQAAQIPTATVEGTKRDMEQYETVREAPEDDEKRNEPAEERK
jgi:hypothetical protein